jgi:hypothetical protein
MRTCARWDVEMKDEKGQQEVVQGVMSYVKT